MMAHSAKFVVPYSVAIQLDKTKTVRMSALALLVGQPKARQGSQATELELNKAD